MLRNTPELDAERETLLAKLKSMMELRSNIESILPVADAACRLHFRLGDVTSAQRLAHLRISLVGGALGVDTGPTTMDPSLAQRLTAMRPENVQTLVRVLVEGAHLMKHTGMLSDALRYYRVATNVVTATNKGKNAVSVVPFHLAQGEVEVMLGAYDAALEHFERARTFAELANMTRSVLCEIDDPENVRVTVLLLAEIVPLFIAGAS